jgi:hypothetical protein
MNIINKINIYIYTYMNPKFNLPLLAVLILVVLFTISYLIHKVVYFLLYTLFVLFIIFYIIGFIKALKYNLFTHNDKDNDE